MLFETISVVGLGYIGLPTAAMFASRKKRVIGVDINQHAVDIINQGGIHIVEPDLDMIVHAAVSEGYLRATTEVEPADAFLIAVPTPFLASEADNIPTPDLSFIKQAAESIAKVLKKGDLVILESTSPVGATEQLAKWLTELRSDLKFPIENGDDADVNIAHCPERVLPGRVVKELVENDRVIGGITPKCSERAISLYKAFVQGDCVVTNARTAEMAKLTENSSRDVQIAFANELSIICDELNIDVWELIKLANRHPRVNILNPGPGVGGHCIAVDPWFIVSRSPNHAKLIHTARTVNDFKPEWVISRIKNLVFDFLQKEHDVSFKDVSIACYGITFKPNIDDIRESPSLKIVEMLAENVNCMITVVEPMIKELPNQLKAYKNIKFSSDIKLVDSNISVLLVNHDCFKEITFGEIERFCR